MLDMSSDCKRLAAAKHFVLQDVFMMGRNGEWSLLALKRQPAYYVEFWRSLFDEN